MVYNSVPPLEMLSLYTASCGLPGWKGIKIVLKRYCNAFLCQKQMSTKLARLVP